MDKLLRVAVVLSAIDKMSDVVKGATNKSVKEMERLRNQDKALRGGAQIAAGAAVLGVLQDQVKAAADFETQMNSVRKVVDGLNDKSALKEFAGDIERLAREIPLPTEQLIDLAAAGGRMGIARENLAQYVRDVSKMSMAFDAPAGEIGEQMGKLTTMFDIPINKVSDLADTINYLDDKTQAKGPEIIDVLMRTAGTAKQIGIADKNLAALASTFLTLGSRPEVAGTAINALMRELAIAEMQPKRFQDGLEALGLSASKMQSMMKIDPQGTILEVLEKVKNSKDGLSLATQLFGKEHGDDITKLAQGLKEYTTELDLLNDAKRKGSMDREFEVRNEEANSQYIKMTNTLDELKRSFGAGLLEPLKKAAELFKPVIDAIANFVKAHPKVAQFIALFMGFSAVAAVVVGAFAVMGSAATAFGITFNLATAGIPLIIGAIAAGAVWVMANWEKVSAFFSGLWEGVRNIFAQAVVALIELAVEPAKALEATINKVKELTGMGKQTNVVGKWVTEHNETYFNKMGVVNPKFGVSDEYRKKMEVVRPGPKADALVPKGNSSVMNFAPNITLQGGATKEDGVKLTDTMKSEFKKMLDDYQRSKARLAY